MSDVALTLDNVTKQFSGHLAVNQLSLEVPRGMIYGILGPNGAGKSTTLRMIMNIIARDSGQISLLGSDPARDGSVLRRIGYLPEERGLYKRMKVIDTILFFAQLKGMDVATARHDALDWLDRMGLGHWSDKKIETLSKGMQQKVQFITTVLHKPEMLVLDEPQSGLDPVNQEIMRDTILSAKKEGRTVLLSTHYMNEAERMCDTVCIIAQGKKILDGPVDELRRSHRGNRFYVEFDERTPEVETFMRTDRHMTGVQPERRGYELELAHGVETAELIRALNGLQTPLSRFEHIEPSLHQIFVRQVTGMAQPERREAANA